MSYTKENIGVVDVIIPVYNNFQFIERAIASAHDDEIVNAVIVVNDGSTDETEKVIERILPKYPKLKLIHHEGNANKGIAASRNEGIRAGSSEWIAFLDSDDYYLPGRFDKLREVIAAKTPVNAIYEAVINKVISKQGAKRFKDCISGLNDYVFEIKCEPNLVFEGLFYGRVGVVHLNGLIVKRSLVYSVGLFDTNLVYAEDSVFRLKIAYSGNLLKGSDSPVAVRTIHETNSEPNIQPVDLFKKYMSLYRFLIKNKAKRSFITYTSRRALFQLKRSGKGWSGYLLVFKFLIRHPQMAVRLIG